MNQREISQIRYLLNLDKRDAARISAQLAVDLVEEHAQCRIRRRASPPSDAAFARRIGLGPDAYAKIKRNAGRGRICKWSRKSLAAMSLCDGLPEAIRKRAHQLLWLIVLQGTRPACRELGVVREALSMPPFFAGLSEEACDLVVASDADASPQRADGGVHAA